MAKEMRPVDRLANGIMAVFQLVMGVIIGFVLVILIFSGGSYSALGIILFIAIVYWLWARHKNNKKKRK